MKNIDWANLKFGYMKTDYNVRCYYRNGKWGEIEVCSDENINLSMAATCLHYGQEAFEGLKAYRCPDGKVRVFRMDENAARLQSTCRGIMMPEVHSYLRERRHALYKALADRYVGSGGRASGFGVHVPHLCNARGPLLQGRVLCQSLCHYPRL